MFCWSATHFLHIIRIKKDLGAICFWSHGQSFSSKVYITKVRVHLQNSKVGQVLTPTLINLFLPRVGARKQGPGNFAASNHPHSCKVSKVKLACQQVKLQISQSNLTYFTVRLPCHLSLLNTLFYSHIMNQGMLGSPSQLRYI